MDLALKDKVVWITGASGGIGRALARVFAAEGAQLALHGHAGFDALGAWVREQPWGARALLVRADVRSADELSRCADEVRARYGRIDVLSIRELAGKIAAMTGYQFLISAVPTLNRFSGSLASASSSPCFIADITC